MVDLSRPFAWLRCVLFSLASYPTIHFLKVISIFSANAPHRRSSSSKSKASYTSLCMMYLTTNEQQVKFHQQITTWIKFFMNQHH
jgi:hypothetical protein